MEVVPEEECSKVPVETCKMLVSDYRTLLMAVMANIAFATYFYERVLLFYMVFFSQTFQFKKTKTWTLLEVLKKISFKHLIFLVKVKLKAQEAE